MEGNGYTRMVHVPRWCCKADKKKGKLKNLSTYKYVVCYKSTRVVNYVSGKAHLWSYGTRTLCRRWVCGSPDIPSTTAVFADLHSPTTSSSSSNWVFCCGEKLSFLQLDHEGDTGIFSDSDDFEDDL